MELRNQARFIARGTWFVSAWLESKVDRGELRVTDPRATAVVLLDALTSYWMQRQTESDEPYGVDDERFIDAWIELIAGLAP